MINGQAAMAMADGSETRGSGVLTGRLIGLSIVAVAPTLFWSGMLYAGALAYGRPLSLWTVGLVATIMFAFLTCIWASFAMADQRDPGGE